MEKIKYLVTLSAEEFKKCEVKADDLGFEIIDNPKESQRKEKPFAIKLEKEHNTAAGLDALDKEALHKLAFKSYVIERQGEFRNATRQQLGLSVGRTANNIGKGTVAANMIAAVKTGTMDKSLAERLLEGMGIYETDFS